MHEAPGKAKPKEDERVVVACGDRVDDRAPWNDSAISFSGSTASGVWVLAGRFGVHDYAHEDKYLSCGLLQKPLIRH